MERVVSAYSRHRGCIALPTCGVIAAAPMLALLSSGAQKINPLCVYPDPPQMSIKIRRRWLFLPKALYLMRKMESEQYWRKKDRDGKFHGLFAFSPEIFPDKHDEFVKSPQLLEFSFSFFCKGSHLMATADCVIICAKTISPIREKEGTQKGWKMGEVVSAQLLYRRKKYRIMQRKKQHLLAILTSCRFGKKPGAITCLHVQMKKIGGPSNIVFPHCYSLFYDPPSSDLFD